jgi:hypothetical protein
MAPDLHRRILLLAAAPAVLGVLSTRERAVASEAEMDIGHSKSVAWQRIRDDLSFEICVVGQMASGHGLAGHVMAADGERPLDLTYRIECDKAWQTRYVRAEQAFEGSRRALTLAQRGGRWRLNDRAAAQLDGCTDVDLGLSPSTNMLPINRLDVPVGGHADILAAWVQFPSLRVTPARQRYERLGDRRWRYTSLSSGFTAEIDVDESGLPILYENVWRRCAAWQP